MLNQSNGQHNKDKQSDDHVLEVFLAGKIKGRDDNADIGSQDKDNKPGGHHPNSSATLPGTELVVNKGKEILPLNENRWVLRDCQLMIGAVIDSNTGYLQQQADNYANDEQPTDYRFQSGLTATELRAIHIELIPL
jgi:hypothetical protein